MLLRAGGFSLSSFGGEEAFFFVLRGSCRASFRFRCVGTLSPGAFARLHPCFPPRPRSLYPDFEEEDENEDEDDSAGSWKGEFGSGMCVILECYA